MQELRKTVMNITKDRWRRLTIEHSALKIHVICVTVSRTGRDISPTSTSIMKTEHTNWDHEGKLLS
jgi:hypothetical protein